MKRIYILTLTLIVFTDCLAQDLRNIYQNGDSAAFEQYLTLNEVIYFPNLGNKVNKAVFAVTAAAARDHLDEVARSIELKGGHRRFYLLDNTVKVFVTKKRFGRNRKSIENLKIREQGIYFGNSVIYKSNLISPIILDNKILEQINDTTNYNEDLLRKREKLLKIFFLHSFRAEKLHSAYRVNKLIFNKKLDRALLTITFEGNIPKTILYQLNSGYWQKMQDF